MIQDVNYPNEIISRIERLLDNIARGNNYADRIIQKYPTRADSATVSTMIRQYIENTIQEIKLFLSRYGWYIGTAASAVAVSTMLWGLFLM